MTLDALLGLLFAVQNGLRKEIQSYIGTGIKDISSEDKNGKTSLVFTLIDEEGKEKEVYVNIDGVFTKEQKKLVINIIENLTFSNDGDFLFNGEKIALSKDFENYYTKAEIDTLLIENSEDTSHIELTQAEYDLLSDEEKSNGTIYFITDGEQEDTSHVELTQAEYELLSEEEKSNGTIYFITDAEQEDTSHVELTQAEYNELTDEEKSNGTIYFITDVNADDDSHVELTQAEYDALTDEEKSNGTIYFITDAEQEDTSHIELTQAEYDLLSDEERTNGTIYFITDVDQEDTSHVELTQVEYDQLTEEEKANGTIYFITDAEENDSNTCLIELTQAEYNALTNEEKNNGTIYFVTDEGSEDNFDGNITAEKFLFKDGSEAIRKDDVFKEIASGGMSNIRNYVENSLMLHDIGDLKQICSECGTIEPFLTKEYFKGGRVAVCGYERELDINDYPSGSSSYFAALTKDIDIDILPNEDIIISCWVNPNTFSVSNNEVKMSCIVRYYVQSTDTWNENIIPFNCLDLSLNSWQRIYSIDKIFQKISEVGGSKINVVLGFYNAGEESISNLKISGTVKIALPSIIVKSSIVYEETEFLSLQKLLRDNH